MLWIAALAVSVLGSSAAIAQNMTLTSSDLKEGGTIVNEQVFMGFGCAGGNASPALSWSGAPSGTKSFAVSIYDPERADRQRVVALGCVQYSAGHDVVAQGRRRREQETDGQGSYLEPYRLRSRRIWWPLPAAWRKAASLPNHGFCC
jgi:hypothetical protein